MLESELDGAQIVRGKNEQFTTAIT
jgi:hypothetical protein